MARLRTLDLLAKKAKKEKEAVKNKTEKTVEEIIVKKEEVKEQKAIQLEIKIKKEPVVWDVKIGDPIEYFDPDLSYELTGYRPIDENRGLDFDPLPFSENAKIYETTGYYTTYVKGFKLYDDFWRELVRRCKDGYTVNDYTITGDHYFFLNFYRIKSPVKGAGSTDGSNFGETFPTFCVELYKWFHYLALCEKLNLDANALKPRAVGWSEIAASMGLRNYTIKRKSQGIYTAFNSDMLGPTISKVWDGMEFLNTCTGGGLKHLRMVKNTADIKRASLKLKDGTEVGFKSEIRTVITDNPRKLRGSRVERLFFEEAGSHPELLRTYTQAEALVEIGGTKVGIRLSWGCVCKDTILYNLHGEPVLVQDLKIGDKILGFKDGNTTVEPITYIQEPCEKPCYEIITKYGNLKCSFDHPILTRLYYKYKKQGKIYWRYDYIYKMACDINEKDFIIYTDGILLFGNQTIDDPYFIGLLIGDGSYGKNKTPRLFSCDSEIYNYVEKKYNAICERSHITKDNKLYKELRINGTGNMLKKCGIYGLTKKSKRLPDNYLSLNKNDLAELLAGLFDTDGYFSKTRYTIEIDQSSEEIIKQIQECLIKFGIYSTYFEHKPLLKEGRKDKNSWFVLMIRDLQSIVNFYKNIPIKIQYKLLNLKRQVDSIKPKKRIIPEGYREVKVNSITDIGMQHIYNLTANNTHTYIANNIVTHNTGGDHGPALAGLATIFYNPEAYKVLPYRNNFNMKREYVLTGFFIPAYHMVWNKMDHRGFCSETAGREYYDKERMRKSKDAQALMAFKSEFCYFPEEALIREGSNRFDAEKIAEQITNIELHKTVELPIRGRLSWPLNKETGNIDMNQTPVFTPDPNGKILITEYPMSDDKGIVYNNLYVAGCLTPGEKVLTTKGLKNVEDITLFDKLYNIDGKEANIINIQEYDLLNEDIYTIRLNNVFETTTFTKEHPIYCCTPKKKYHHAKTVLKSNYTLPYSYYEYKFDFKKAEEVKVGDFVKTPNIYKRVKPIPSNIWDESNIRIDRRIGYHLNDKNFWWFIGLWLGDGWCESRGRIVFSFNAKEVEYIEKYKHIVSNIFGRSYSLAKNKETCYEYHFTCLYLNEFLLNNFSKGAKNKNLPEWVKYMPHEYKIELLMGFLASDGCIYNNNLSFVSISKKLLLDMLDILFSIGIISSLTLLRKEKIIENKFTKGKTTKLNETYLLRVHGLQLNNFKRIVGRSDYKLDKYQIQSYTNHEIPRCFFEDETYDYIYIKVYSIEKSKYSGTVYNYHCTGNTFIGRYIPTHNCDSIDSDTSSSSGQSDVSDFCILIKKRTFGLSEPKYVAMYKDRPRDIRTAYDNAIKLLMWYNAKCVVEATRVGIITYFKEKNKLNLLFKRPRATLANLATRNINLYGTPATPAIIEHQLELIEMFIQDYCYSILFLEMLLELLKYSYENKRKFDIVAAMGLTELADEELFSRPPRALNNISNNWKDIGYYYDNGVKKFGVIPSNYNKEDNMIRNNYDWIRI